VFMLPVALPSTRRATRSTIGPCRRTSESSAAASPLSR
jgi:hypothetical protein